MEYESVIRKLNGRGFLAELCENGAAAKQRALEIIGDGSVGIGGSATVRDLGLYEALRERGNTVCWHWKAEKELKKQARDEAIRCDVYLSSCNALLTDGRMVNIDGTANRVTGLLYGPERVIIIAGRNKIVEGTLDDAIERIKRKTCPGNARRQKFETPCARTGQCADCRVKDRMCCVTVVHETPTKVQKEVHVLLVDEDLGL